MWKLVIEDDEGKRTVVPLTRDDYTIGRQEGNTIRLTERNVSREHGRLRRRRLGANGGGKDDFVLDDKSSYNGLFVNGLRVAETHDLQHGDLIQIGDYRIVLQDDMASAVETPVLPLTNEFDAKATVPMATGFRGQDLTDRPSRFVMLVGPTPGVEFPLDRERLTIGRAEDSSISVNHNSVSRLHCEVHALGDGRYEIVDKGSSNGVRVNAVELKRSIIEAGDVIELGDVRFKFVGAGQVFVPGPNESQQLTAISDREAELADPRRSRGWGGYAFPIVGAGVVGALIILAFVYVLRSRGGGSEGGSIAVPSDAERMLVLEAKRTCSTDDCESSYLQISTLPEKSPWRDSADVRSIEATWADSMMRKARAENDPTSKRALLLRVAGAHSLDDFRRQQASTELAALETPPATPSQLPGATKDSGPGAVTPGSAQVPPTTTLPPTIRTSTPATTPPSTVTATPPVTTTARPAPVSALERARAAALDGRPADVRQLLERNVRAGHGSAEEVRLVKGACQAQGDMACIEELRKLSAKDKGGGL